MNEPRSPRWASQMKRTCGFGLVLSLMSCVSWATTRSDDRLSAGEGALVHWAPRPSPVSVRTTSVAIIPRPARVWGPWRRDCPERSRGLTRWKRSWLKPDGTITIPPRTRALLRGNRDIPADLLIRDLYVPAGSELVFADMDATFRVRDIRVAGALRLGAPGCRLRSHIEFIFDTDENVADPAVREQIYERAGLGLVVEPGGALDAFGILYQPTWTRLSKTAWVGANAIELAERVDWRPGQEVVVVTSALRDYPFQNQNEVRTIADRRDGRTLLLDRPLDFLHYGGPEYQVEVGLLSRNLIFRTAQSVLDAAPGFGGHILVHASRARISSVEVRGLGQRNFLGRYPLHFHHAGDVRRRSYFTDNSIRSSNWRCAVVHRTDNAIVSRNVAFDTYGHCYYLEDGVEQGNEISFNLAAYVKIMGPVDPASLDELAIPDQQGFVLNESSDFVNPADRAAAGFYIPNGRNWIVGNAASGGFAGYSFPNMPAAIDAVPGDPAPIESPIRHFDGNTAHSAGYFWPDSGCVYVGGSLRLVDDGGGPTLQYQSGRPQEPALLRNGEDRFSNTKTFLCAAGIVHWGNAPQVVNLEAWDDALLAQLFGSASIQSAISVGHTGNTDNQIYRHLNWYQRGFRFYDTDTATILRGILFRGYHDDPQAGLLRSQNSCAMISLTHSDEFTPQRMTATAEFHFDDVDDKLRFCHDDTGTLSSRNFNLNDTDGSASLLPGDLLPPGPRIIGSAYTDIWNMNPGCVRNDDWGLWVCPQRGTRNVAAIATLPNRGVRVVMRELDGHVLGENWYSDIATYDDAQITGPSGLVWYHSFPDGFPESFRVHVEQVPDGSFVIYAFSVPQGEACSIDADGWSPVPNFGALRASGGSVYTTDHDVCYIRIQPANQGYFEAAGLRTPFQVWENQSSLTDFIVHTGP